MCKDFGKCEISFEAIGFRVTVFVAEHDPFAIFIKEAVVQRTEVFFVGNAFFANQIFVIIRNGKGAILFGKIEESIGGAFPVSQKACE